MQHLDELDLSLKKLESSKDGKIKSAVFGHGHLGLIDANCGYLGCIPSRWKLDKIKHHLSRIVEKGHPDETILSLYREYGVLPKDSRDDNHNVTSEDTSKYQLVCPGDFVINKMKAWQGSMAISNHKGIISPAYYVYRFKDNVFSKRYFHYLLRNKRFVPEFRRLSGGIREGQWDLPAEAFENLFIPVPPLDEQEEIARFLDAKCAEIDALMEKMNDELDGLKLFRLSAISRFVSLGVNSHAKIKKTALQWIPNIPSHWQITKLKRLLSRNDGGVWGEEPTNSETDCTVLRSTEQTVDGKWAISDPAKRSLKGIANLRYYVIEQNDLLVTKSSGSKLHIGKTTIADERFVSNRYFYSNFLQRLRVSSRLLPNYLWYFLNCPISREQFVYMQNSTSGIGNINSDDIGNLFIPIPPLSEQKEIALFLNQKCTEIDQIIKEKETQLETLDAYKKSLIYEYVTGKKEVAQ